MSDPQHEIRTWALTELAKRGHGAKGQLAKFLDVRPDAITRMTNTSPGKETREIRAHELELMRKFFADETYEDDEDLGTVPLVGFVGAGAAAHYYAEGQGEHERVKAPNDANPETVAVQIKGDSLGPLFDTWLVYYDDVRSEVTSDMIGVPCVVGLPDDRVLIKSIRRAKSPGFYHLESNTEPTILDVEIVWAAKVKSMGPR